MRDVLAMVLAGGRVEELSVLTRARPKAAVPFGGQYLVIDFVMTNLMRSGVRKIGILSQYRPSSLIEHIGSGEAWDFWGRDRFVKLLPPYQGSERWDWYRGTADAIHQNHHIIESAGCEHVLVLSGDHVYRMDYRALYEEHIERGADLTAVFMRVPGLTGQPTRFGVAEVDEAGRVTGYEEKPAAAKSDLASLTIYLFRRDALVRHLNDNARTGRTFQLYDEVLPAMVAEGRVHCCLFEGYWAYGRTVDAYYRANMDLLQESEDGLSVALDSWNVLTNEESLGLGDSPPAEFGPQAAVVRSRVAPGARIHGRVERSILAPGVTVAEGAVVRDSLLLGTCVIEAGARVERVIADAGVRVGAGASVGAPEGREPAPPPNALRPETLSSGATLLGEGVHVPDGCVIGRNCIVGARGHLAPGQVVPDGAALDA